MEVAYLSAASALAGSLVGGITAGVTSWLNQRAQARSAQLARDLARRGSLYKDFIAAASKTYGEAVMSSEPNFQDLVALYAMISRMRILSHPQTVACADKVMLATIDTYFAPNRSVPELRQMIKSGTGIDPLKDFSEAAREEMQTLIV
jgi:hypothetical protein